MKLSQELATQIQNTPPCGFHGAELVDGNWVATLTFQYPSLNQTFIFRIKLDLLNEYKTALSFSKHLHDLGLPPKLVKDICLAIQQTRHFCNQF